MVFIQKLMTYFCVSFGITSFKIEAEHIIVLIWVFFDIRAFPGSFSWRDNLHEQDLFWAPHRLIITHLLFIDNYIILKVDN